MLFPKPQTKKKRKKHRESLLQNKESRICYLCARGGVSVRKKYELYENKICTGEEAAQCRGCLEARVKRAGYQIVTARGDVKPH